MPRSNSWRSFGKTRPRRREHRLMLERLEDRTLLNAGQLDTTFGMSGEVITPFASATSAIATAVAVQPDGKILVGGAVVFPSDTERGLVRYLPNGSLDGTFGTGGVVLTKFRGNQQPPFPTTAIVPQPDCKILVAGTSLTRYNADGSLDTTFGSGGFVDTFAETDLALQPDGKILVLGQGLVRFNADGRVDTTFTASLPVGSLVSTLDLQPDGRIIVSSGSSLQRFNADGSPDSTFRSGLTPIAVGSVLDQAGRVVVAGADILNLEQVHEHLGIDRILTNGHFDATFGNGGIVEPNPSTEQAVGGASLLIQPDGRILAFVTSAGLSGPQSSVLLRFNPNGTQDVTFGTTTATTPVTGLEGVSRAAALQADGKVIVVGLPAQGAAAAFGVVRYSADTRPTDANQRFVAQVYLDLLQRPVDATGLAVWTAALAGGLTRTQVVALIETSLEYRVQQVQGEYGYVLERPATPQELTSLVGFLIAGGTEKQLETFLLGSDEYNLHAAISNTSFLGALYGDVLHRPIDGPGFQFWNGLLNKGVSRTAVAAAVLNSPEADALEVQMLYQQYLRRSADPGGLNGFTSLLELGLPLEIVRALVMGSAEYLNRL